MTVETLQIALMDAAISITSHGGKIDAKTITKEAKRSRFIQESHDLPCLKLSIPLESFKGRNTKKHAQIQIWFHDNGRFESNAYCM